MTFQDVIYHNEAFSRSSSSIDSSPSKYSTKDCTPSPKRGSFVSAVIGAIRNAATQPFTAKQINEKKLIESNKSVKKGNIFVLKYFIDRKLTISLSSQIQVWHLRAKF